MFVPSFRASAREETSSRADISAGAVFSDLSRAVEDVASDYHEEYDFKKYLQDTWNALVERPVDKRSRSMVATLSRRADSEPAFDLFRAW